MTTSRILAAGLMLAACGMASDHTRAVLQPGTLAEPWLTGVARSRFVGQAARALSDAAAAPPQLSSSTALDRSRARMLERLEGLRRNPLRAAPEQ